MCGGAGWLPNLEFYFVPVVLAISLGVGWFLTECVEIPWQYWIRGAHKPGPRRRFVLFFWLLEVAPESAGGPVDPACPLLCSDVLDRIAAMFLPVSPRFLRVFTASPRRFRRAASRNPGPRNSRHEGQDFRAPPLRSTPQMLTKGSTDWQGRRLSVSAAAATAARRSLRRRAASTSPSPPRPSRHEATNGEAVLRRIFFARAAFLGS